MSFVGGGSDLPGYYRQYGGAVVSTAINKYVYVTVNKKFDNGFRVAYSKNEEVDRITEIEHRLVRATLEDIGITGGVEITTIADVPSKGTGLGSSSSFAVGLINALSAYTGKYVSAESLGQKSCHIEIDVCGEPIGKQDQYAAAFGGLNFIEFRPDDTVVVMPIIADVKTINEISGNVMMFFTGMTRSASKLLEQQGKEMAAEKKKQETMQRMVELAYTMRDELQKNNASSFGEILHENWQLKKSLTAGISNSDIDDWYEIALRAGATGGKLLGAGAGGFLMLYAPKERHEAIASALNMLRRIDIGFEPLGSRIIFYH
jgi:D-glycero-alpha-D-manno-heptose-7-phosphate kinase